MITIKVKLKNRHEKIAHVKNVKDCAAWLSLLHGDFDRVTIRDHKKSIDTTILSKMDLSSWIELNK